MEKSPKTPSGIAIIGLGYVGLPLALAFSRHFRTVGYDINRERVQELRAGRDRTNELDDAQLKELEKVHLTADINDTHDCDTFVVTVPTPINDANEPDLSLLVSACQAIGPIIMNGATIIFESTVYPGATEEVCVPVLEQVSGKKFNRDFFVGYSPERINPGDRVHTLETVVKLTSGSTPETAEYVDSLYRRIVNAGTFKLNHIREAEAAKVIENVQRDVNIALMNELAKIFKRLDIDTQKVLEAAGSKWNFLPFLPGLVGGHCIGIDPYYLDHKARQAGYEPTIIPASRRINESMGSYIAERVMLALNNTSTPRVLVLGLSFKENCPDLRNTKVTDIVSTLVASGAAVDIYDPWVNTDEAEKEHGLALIQQPENDTYDAIVLAVRHECFIELGIEQIRKWGKQGCFVFDVKYLFDGNDTDERL